MLSISLLVLSLFTTNPSNCQLRTINLQYSIEDNLNVDEDTVKLTSNRRHRREPAIWGESAPDYRAIALDGTIRLLKTILFIDAKIELHYNDNMKEAKREVMKLVREANSYFFQIDLRIIVVDILPTKRNNFSLYSFENYRNNRLAKLPEHDFSALISYRYAGGLAFVGGLCTPKAVMLCGFYPHNPAAMGGIFFHEVAHLFGVPHKNANESLEISNCNCMTEERKRSANCLKIPGFDHNCTLQQMVNLMNRNKCIEKYGKYEFFDPITYGNSVPICGNGVIEKDEQCDCGIESENYCYIINCRPNSCMRVIQPWLLRFALVFGVLLTLSITLACKYANYFVTSQKAAVIFISNSLRISNLFNSLEIFSIFDKCKRRLFKVNNKRFVWGVCENIQSSNTVLENKKFANRQAARTLIENYDKPYPTIRRPIIPPPPPPISILRSLHRADYEETICLKRSDEYSEDSDEISRKFDDFDETDEEVEEPCQYLSDDSFSLLATPESARNCDETSSKQSPSLHERQISPNFTENTSVSDE